MTRQDKREILLLVMLEDCANVFKLRGYTKAATKIEANLQRLYPNGKPDTTEARETINARRMD
jgi:hypothetical protein